MRSALVVDDHVDLSEIVQYILTHEGYRVILAHDVHSALIAAARELPHLILMDVTLPEQDGAQIVRTLRQQEDTQNTPVVFLTSSVNDESAWDEQRMPVDGKTYPVLSKTMGREELLKRIKSFVESNG